ncbi:MAG: hypothetical protein ABJO30_03035 [Hyphomicrobiales bacterium]
MAQRRKITQEFLATITIPSVGEVWIADTEIRGFGLRIQSTGHVSFCIRTKDYAGSAKRLTYRTHENLDKFFSWSWDDGRQFSDEFFRLAGHLQHARNWAEKEIAILKRHITRELADENETLIEAEYQQMKQRHGAALGNMVFGRLVEIVCNYYDPLKFEIGRDHKYADRLRNAFDRFDPAGEKRLVRVRDLERETIWRWIKEAQLSRGTLKDLRTLLNITFTNVEELGGPRKIITFPRRPHWLETHELSKLDDKFYAKLSGADKERFLACVTSITKWRTKFFILICLEIDTPVNRILKGRWSEIVADRWVPYAPEDNGKWQRKFEYIGPQLLSYLKETAKAASDEGIVSDFWFPSAHRPDYAIQNITRHWKSILMELNWPPISFAKFTKLYRSQKPFHRWRNIGTNEEAASVLPAPFGRN